METAVEYIPYQWLGEPHDTHVAAFNSIQGKKMNEWFHSLPRKPDEMGMMICCPCGEWSFPSWIDEQWIIKHYEHRKV